MELLLKNSQCTLQVKNPDSVFSSERYCDAISTERKIIFSSLIGQIFVHYLLKYTEVYTGTMDNKYFYCVPFCNETYKVKCLLKYSGAFPPKEWF